MCSTTSPRMVGGGGYPGAAESWEAIYTLSPEGQAAYGAELDRYAAELTGWPSMGVIERFLLALADRTPSAHAREQFSRLAQDDRFARAGEPGERGRATVIVQRALEWAAHALARGGAESQPAAGGLRSISVANAEEASYPAEHIRQQYAAALPDGDLKECVLAVADAADALYDTRPIARDADRHVDESAFLVVADHAAAAAAAGGRSGLFDPFTEASGLATTAAERVPV